MCGHRVPPQSVIHFYSATKYAVTALTEGLRQELLEAQTHIRATVRLWSSPGGNGTGPALLPAHAQEGLLRALGAAAPYKDNLLRSLTPEPMVRLTLLVGGADLKGAWSESKGNQTLTGGQHSGLFLRRPHG